MSWIPRSAAADLAKIKIGPAGGDHTDRRHRADLRDRRHGRGDGVQRPAPPRDPAAPRPSPSPSTSPRRSRTSSPARPRPCRSSSSNATTCWSCPRRRSPPSTARRRAEGGDGTPGADRGDDRVDLRQPDRDHQGSCRRRPGGDLFTRQAGTGTGASSGTRTTAPAAAAVSATVGSAPASGRPGRAASRCRAADRTGGPDRAATGDRALGRTFRRTGSASGPGEVILQLDHVSKTYASGALEVHALQDVSLTDRAAASTSRSSGRPGSGKSTLMNILGCLDVADLGAYRLAGVDVERDERDPAGRGPQPRRSGSCSSSSTCCRR